MELTKRNKIKILEKTIADAVKKDKLNLYVLERFTRQLENIKREGK